ncbi:MAG: threonylcarbamoyl-AMP synthase [Clostridiales bacterium]|nr:threonylcarbamoyl-AMP synthase [Clostridiales bacterium]
MNTLLKKPDAESISLAAKLLREGNIVAIPTETVYGIAGDATNGEAIKKIFEAKGRPQDNPLIVHISDMDMLYEVVASVNDDALKLADAFWPGPLTIILPKGDKISPENCAGLDSVGVRMPSDPVAHAIIKESGIPLGAPSANLSGKPSPTSAEDVFADMDGRLPLIIDGGDCFCGVESTVVSLLEDIPVLLRPGYVTKEDMEEVLGKPVKVSSAILDKLKEGQTARSPGMKYKHYAPKADITILEGDIDSFIEYVNKNKADGVFALCFDGEESLINAPCISYGAQDDGAAQAHKLFSALRELDKQGAKTVYARCPKKDGVSLAVYNRLIRAASFNLVRL